jgi:hypothetical protein
MRIAWGLVHLKLELEEYAKMSAEDNRDVTILQWEAIEHEFDIEFPTDEPLLYPVPVMGPLKGESDMEPYGRCWELLKYFSSVQGPMWESRFGTVVKIRNAPLVVRKQFASVAEARFRGECQRPSEAISKPRRLFSSNSCQTQLG